MLIGLFVQVRWKLPPYQWPVWTTERLRRTRLDSMLIDSLRVYNNNISNLISDRFTSQSPVRTNPVTAHSEGVWRKRVTPSTASRAFMMLRPLNLRLQTNGGAWRNSFYNRSFCDWQCGQLKIAVFNLANSWLAGGWIECTSRRLEHFQCGQEIVCVRRT